MNDNPDSDLEPLRHAKPAAVPRLLFECFAIFLSVLLALLVEQWREDRSEARNAAAALGLVRAELQQNLDEMQRVAPNRAVSLEAYQRAITQLIDENKFPRELPEFELPVVTNIAYELATDSGAVTTVEASDLLVIARAYNSVEMVQRNEVFLNQRNAQIRFNDGEQYLSGFIYYLNRAISSEPDAIRDIQSAIALLDERLD